MAKLRIVIHPLLFVFGLYFALIGKVFSFIIVVLTALLHEFGHYLASESYGYKLDKIVLLPFGALLSGDGVSLKYRDEIWIAFAGPLANFIVVIFFVSLWWVVPAIYAYTDLVVTANLAVASVNLLPCYPLDGGRIALSTLSLYFKRKTALAIVRIIGVLASLALLALFIFSLFTAPNITVLFFALFMLVGATSGSKSASYVRIYSDFSGKQFDGGTIVNRVAVSKDTTVRSLYKKVGSSACELIVTDGQKIYLHLDVVSSQKLLTQSNPYSTVGDCLHQFEKVGKKLL